MPNNNSAASPVMNEHIAAFLKEQSVVSIATTVNDEPYCASCYYAFEPTENLLVFKSDADTKHIEDALKNSRVAGTILPDKITKAKVKGVQFNGNFMKAEGAYGKKAKETYLKKFPVAGIFRGDIWVIEITRVKFTDNTLVFGKKLLWER